MQRAWLLVACLVGLPSAGCVFPYCAPRIDYTPALKLDTPSGEVRAFRVDTIESKADISVHRVRTLSELPMTHHDDVRAQVKPSVGWGFAVVGALTYSVGTSQSIAVQVYRPGFELVETKSWQRAGQVVWKEAADLEAQERVLEALWPIDRAGREVFSPHETLAAGSTSKAHQDALRFGAGEYERLAALATSPEQQSRLAEKAGKLRERADE